MTKPTLSFRISPALHQRLKKEVKSGEVSKFIEEAIDNKLAERENFYQKLIADYQSIVNKKLQEEVAIWDETLNDAWKKDE